MTEPEKNEREKDGTDEHDKESEYTNPLAEEESVEEDDIGGD